MFGRSRESKSSRNQAAKEQSRRALFEELAKRPQNICPFLGLASSQVEYHDGVTREHRCYAFGEPAELSPEQQERVCLGRGYGNCPRYLRGVLVIPTEELQALRGALPPVRPGGPPPPPPPPAAVAGGGRSRAPLLVGLVLLLALAGSGGAYLLLSRGGTSVGPTPTPLPSSPAPSASASVLPTAAASTAPSVNQTPFPETPKPDPTPLPGDTFMGYEVTVLEGENTLFTVDDQGNITDQAVAHYARFSKAPVDRILAPNGLLHWRTSKGFFTGLSYIHNQSGPFLIRKVYQGTDGTKRYIVLHDNEV